MSKLQHQEWQKISWSKNTNLFKKIAIVVFTLLCVVGVGFAGRVIVTRIQVAVWHLSENTIDIISNTFGKPMIKDANGNINILLVGIGGIDHDGGMLADAIMVASWNPRLHAITLLSVPRDLFVTVEEYNLRGRINQVFSTAYYRNDRDLSVAALALADKAWEVTSLDIPYYVVIDFDGFVDIIDTLWGIDIYVSERIYDTAYPNEINRWYITFHVERWWQHMDGDTALKYARSRHSSSDFARSRRQQDMLAAVLESALKSENIQNISTIKQLYEQYVAMVSTNISNKEIIGMLKYAFVIEHIFSFRFTYECSNRNWRNMSPWCFLYTPLREWFGGASVLLPNGANQNNVSFYEYTSNFGRIVSHEQQFLIEWLRITLLNGIDRSYASAARKWVEWHASQMATKLWKYGFSIIDVGNADSILTGTQAIVYGDIVADSTLKVLQEFLPIDEIIYKPRETEVIINEEWEEELFFIDPGTDITIILGNDYIDFRPAQFNYNI